MMTWQQAFDEAQSGCRKCNRLNLFKIKWSAGCTDREFPDGSHIEHLTWECGCGFWFLSQPLDAAKAAA